MNDPYEVLGLPRTATLEEVRQRYRKLAAKYHPDRGGDAWIIKQIRSAYEQICEDHAAAARPQEPQQPQQPPQPQYSTAYDQRSATPPPPPEAAQETAQDGDGASLGFGLGIGAWTFFTLRKHGLEAALLGVLLVSPFGFGIRMFWGILREPTSPSSQDDGPELTLAVAALIFSLFGLVASSVPWFGLPLCALGFLLSVPTRHGKYRPLALTAMPLALLGYAISGLICLIYLYSLPWESTGLTTFEMRQQLKQFAK